LAFLLQWPTLVTLILFPILVMVYARLAKREEEEVEAQFGEAYRSCRARTRPLSRESGMIQGASRIEELIMITLTSLKMEDVQTLTVEISYTASMLLAAFFLRQRWPFSIPCSTACLSVVLVRFSHPHDHTSFVVARSTERLELSSRGIVRLAETVLPICAPIIDTACVESGDPMNEPHVHHEHHLHHPPMS
jgi:hypothetical protein